MLNMPRLKQCLGMSSVSAQVFINTIKLLHPVVEVMLNEMCDEAKNEMKSLGPIVVGSWERAITTSGLLEETLFRIPHLRSTIT